MVELTEYVIDSYTVYVLNGTHRTYIQLFERDDFRGTISFYPKDSSLVDAKLDSNGRIHLNMHVNRFHPVLDIIRNEKPLYIYYKSSENAGLRTGRETIGEDQMWIT